MDTGKTFDPQSDRRRSIDTARQVLEQAVRDGRPIDAELIEVAAAAVHADWLSRPIHQEPPNPTEHLPYQDLPDDIKEKDRVFVRLALQELQ